MSEPKKNKGQFFPLSIKMIDKIVEQGGNVEAVISAIVLCRGAGMHATTAWTENAIHLNGGVPLIRAKNACKWLGDRQFITVTPSEQEINNDSPSTEAENTQDIEAKIKPSAKKKRWKILENSNAQTYLPNRLVDKAGDLWGPLGKLYREIEVDYEEGSKIDDARLDAVMVLLHFYKEHNVDTYGGVNPQMWHCLWSPVLDGMGPGGSNSRNPILGSSASIYEIERDRNNYCPSFVESTLFYIKDVEERHKRFKCAVDNLKREDFFYEVLNVWSANPLADENATVEYPLYLFERRARTSGEPFLATSINVLAQKVYDHTMSDRLFDQEGESSLKGTDRFRYVGFDKYNFFPMSVIRLRYRANSQDTGAGMASQIDSVAKWTTRINKLQNDYSEQCV